MRRFAPAFLASTLLVSALLAALQPPQEVLARESVDASAPTALSVTVYRDPYADPENSMDLTWLEGFALVSETRTVTLPAGEATVRFPGVVGGMVAVSAIVTGLPGGTIEKNRNAALLSPASLVDGTLGNRVTVTRTNPATGVKTVEDAIVRTRGDGGLVLQTKAGFEAVGCSGVPETLTFDKVPDGLLPVPVYTIDTVSRAGGTHTVRLTYLASGFDWRAHYVARVQPGSGPDRAIDLTAWLTIANENGETLPDAQLLAVAGKLEVVEYPRDLSSAPVAEPLSLTCYPLAIANVPDPPEYIPLPPPPPAPMMMMSPDMEIIVTAQRRSESFADMPVAISAIAEEENLGDLKLYRIPGTADVASKGMKQVAFLDRKGVRGRVIHKAPCNGDDAEWMDPDDEEELAETEFTPASFLWRVKNDKAHDLGLALPMGRVSVFEDAAGQAMLLGEDDVRDYAANEDFEVELGTSPGVALRCTWDGLNDQGSLADGKWHELRADLINLNAGEAAVELVLGSASDWQVRGVPGKVYFRDGRQTVDLKLKPGQRRMVKWKVRRPD